MGAAASIPFDAGETVENDNNEHNSNINNNVKKNPAFDESLCSEEQIDLNLDIPSTVDEKQDDHNTTLNSRNSRILNVGHGKSVKTILGYTLLENEHFVFSGSLDKTLRITRCCEDFMGPVSDSIVENNNWNLKVSGKTDSNDLPVSEGIITIILLLL